MTTIPPETRKTLTVDMLSYIGLANKRMDNFIEAFKCYEEAIIIKSTANSPNEGQPIIGNGKVLQQAAKEWYGTSGKITSWESPEDVESMCCMSIGLLLQGRMSEGSLAKGTQTYLLG
jgi:hypothetical protein